MQIARTYSISYYILSGKILNILCNYSICKDYRSVDFEKVFLYANLSGSTIFVLIFSQIYFAGINFRIRYKGRSFHGKKFLQNLILQLTEKNLQIWPEF